MSYDALAGEQQAREGLGRGKRGTRHAGAVPASRGTSNATREVPAGKNETDPFWEGSATRLDEIDVLPSRSKVSGTAAQAGKIGEQQSGSANWTGLDARGLKTGREDVRGTV